MTRGRRAAGEPAALGLVRDAAQAAALLTGDRRRLLEELRRPTSASGLARRLGMPRQRVNYHVRELERAGLVEPVEERLAGNCLERVMRATARRYVISPEVLGDLGTSPDEVRDSFSSSYLISVAARTLHELAGLRDAADTADERLATMTLEAEVRFASASQRDAFARELSQALARLVMAYHDSSSKERRSYRVLLAAYPKPATRDAGGDGRTVPPSSRDEQP